MNDDENRRWTSYDIERPEKILAIVWTILVVALIVYALLTKLT